MKTKIKTPQDAIDVLNENLEGLLTGKRKVMVVKEVNNTIGKLLDIHKLEAANKAITKDNTPLSWFCKEQHLIAEFKK